MKKILLLFLLLTLFSCQQLKRMGKDIKANTKGLDRVVSVYSQNGNLLKTYKGRIDIETNDYGNKVKFELYGKRIMINNAVVITEEFKPSNK